jgi:hypothetical protein
MKEANPTTAPTDAREPLQPDAGRSEIRLLDDLELVLAGGGESDANWP